MSTDKTAAKAFTSIVISMGVAVLISALFDWESRDPVRYYCYSLLALLSSGWKVALPTFPGTVSIGYLFVLIGFVDFSFPETLLLGCACVAVQSALDCREEMAVVPLLFHVSNLALAIAAGDYVVRSSWVPESGDSPILPLAAAAIVLSLMNTFPAAAFAALRQGDGIGEVWHRASFWTTPTYLAGAAIAAMISGLSRLVGWETALVAFPITYLVFRAASRYLEEVKVKQADAEEWASRNLRTIETFGLIVEARRCSKDDHTTTRIYAQEIGKRIGLSQVELQALRVAANLHDIGILAVPEQIISKKGRLTREEFEKVKTHPAVGAAILEQVDYPFPVVPIVRSHHERWNGTGYPDGLKGNAIPAAARVLAVVDCLGALIADRPYRKALPFNKALALVESESGSSFDPRVVKLLLKHHREFERLAQLELAAQPRQSANEAGADATAKQTPGAPFQPETPDFVSSISQARQETQELFELARDLGSSLSLSETLFNLASRLKPIVGFDCLAIYLQRDDKLVPEYATGTEYPVFLSVEIPLGEGVSGRVAKTGEPLLNAKPALEFSHLESPARTTTMRSALSVPLEASEGTVGVLTLYRQQEAAFLSNHLRILLEVSPKLAQAVENAMKYQTASDSATTDPLTGLANARSLFLHLDNELARCRRTSEPLTVLVCDLDGFKLVNDKFGHMVGNDVLSAVSRVLEMNCREYDYVARLGGDEFVMILPGLPQSAVDAKIRHLSLAVAQAGMDACPEGHVSMSIGQARCPEDGQDSEELLTQADRRMYGAKQRRTTHALSRGYDFDYVSSTTH